ncbi:Endonuclease III like protein [Astathelohania contejeani]|uniref:Endonuclease III like protein n=1 Tax=Astathelohania contejeani TaxID=164912 RepID=A0ABQ7HVS3_9MICR|nr:Endonuclease III like protein [Thelohania contejeani]
MNSLPDSYKIIKNERKFISAPVDKKGCHKCIFSEDPEIRKYHILIALMLSSQTRDEITYGAMENLNKNLRGKPVDGLTPINIVNSTIDHIKSLIKGVGFYNKKAEYIYKVSVIIAKNKKIPTDYKEIIKLPGVGNKMAYLYLQNACEISMGIGVDTHVHRISNKLGLVNTKNPEQTRIALEKIFPVSEWREINYIMVGYGQMICKANNPDCNNCKAKNYCKSYQENLF